jgi:hypothetical protein
MPAKVNLPLFALPFHELNRAGHVGEPVDPEEISRLGVALHERLKAASGVLERLSEGGWDNALVPVGIDFYHPKVLTREDAETRLRQLGLDPRQFSIVEDDEGGGDDVPQLFARHFRGAYVVLPEGGEGAELAPVVVLLETHGEERCGPVEVLLPRAEARRLARTVRGLLG